MIKLYSKINCGLGPCPSTTGSVVDLQQDGIRSQLLPLNGRTRYGYTYTQNSSPICWGVKLTNHVGLLLLMPVWLDYCLSFQEMLN